MSYSQPGTGAQDDDVAGAFAGTASVRAGLAAHGYLADDKIAGVVGLAARLGKPLLVEGPAGTGKTQLAKSVALLAARPLIRLQCYEGIDESKALYEWDYRKQLLWIQAARGDETFSADAVIEDGKGIFDERFLLTRPMLEAIRSPEPARQLGEAAAGLSGADAPGQHLRLELQRTEIAARAEYLKSQVRKVIRELLIADRGADAVAKTLRQPLTADRDISTASREQMREIHRVMIPIQRKLATTVMRKRRHHTDLIDVRATLRASMATGAVPMRIMHRKPRPTKPQLYVLADMSGSVATFATFTITLISAMSQLFSRLRSFAFITDAAEVTDVFRHVRDPDHARRAIRDFVNASQLGGYTDYGRALRQFHGAVAAELERRSTVLIFGDARGNYLPAQEATLARIARRAGSVYWLNPEPRAQWNTGDSTMRAYEPHCTAAVTCRTLNDLRRFIEQLD